MNGIIFDIDGTLWDSRVPVAKAWDKVAKEEVGWDRTLTADDMTKLFGKTTVEIADAIFEGLGLSRERKDEIMYRCTVEEAEYLRSHPGILYEGVRKMLDMLYEKYPLFIVSNCDEGYIEAMLEGVHLEKYFKDYMCFADTHLPKSDNIRIMAERNGVTEPVYVGDTQGDLDSCKKAGVPMVHVSYGLGTADDPAYRVDSPIEVAELLLNL